MISSAKITSMRAILAKQLSSLACIVRTLGTGSTRRLVLVSQGVACRFDHGSASAQGDMLISAELTGTITLPVGTDATIDDRLNIGGTVAVNGSGTWYSVDGATRYTITGGTWYKVVGVVPPTNPQISIRVNVAKTDGA